MSSSPASAIDARGLPVGYPFKPDWEVTPRETARRMAAAEPGLIVLDCRRPEENQASRIDGTRFIPMNEIERRADELESDDGRKDAPIIVHCHHGVRSMRVTATLRGLGFTNVRSMAGGIDLWSLDVDPRIPRY